MVIPTAFGVEPLDQDWPPAVAVLLTPRCEALERGPEFLPCGPAFEVISPLASLSPPTLEPQTHDARFSCRLVPTERADPRLGARPLQAALLQPLPQHVGEAFRGCVVCKRTPELVRGADQTRFASAWLRDHFCAPPITCVVPEPVGQDWCHRAPCVQHAGLQPLPHHPPSGAVITPFRQPPHPPVLLDGITELFAVRFSHPPRRVHIGA